MLVAALPRVGTAGDDAYPLEGAWYVLVHYSQSDTDEANGLSKDPAADRKAWEDKVWVFEQRGSRFAWTEYPVVVLRDERGRMESLASGRRVRTSGHWRPTSRQRTELAKGPAVVSGWARSKTLRGDPERGYRSHGAANRESTSVIAYSERWEIEGLMDLPVFRREDEMSGGRAEALSGLVEYRGTKLSKDSVEGDFVRDEVERGRFRMERVAMPRPVAGDEQGEQEEGY
jgi:hypothetical protein